MKGRGDAYEEAHVYVPVSGLRFSFWLCDASA